MRVRGWLIVGEEALPQELYVGTAFGALPDAGAYLPGQWMKWSVNWSGGPVFNAVVCVDIPIYAPGTEPGHFLRGLLGG